MLEKGLLLQSFLFLCHPVAIMSEVLRTKRQDPDFRVSLCFDRCANCFDCPCCMHTLSTRATSIPAPLPDDPAKTTMKKAYYLACGFCRWTSRDVGMADKSVGKCLGTKGRTLSKGGWRIILIIEIPPSPISKS